MIRKITIAIDDSVTDKEAVIAILHHIDWGKISHKNGEDFYSWATVQDLPNGEEIMVFTSDRSKSPNASFGVVKRKNRLKNNDTTDKI